MLDSPAVSLSGKEASVFGLSPSQNLFALANRQALEQRECLIHNRAAMFRSGRAAAFALFLVLAVAHTWPLALHPSRLSLNDNADAELNEWIMAWVAHQLPRDPRHLFEANIFHPAHDSLAFSEPLIVPALMGAPFAWSGASPVLVYNVILILGFALTGFATCVLVQEWTGSQMAGVLAGSLFAFNTHTLTRLAHVQGIHLYGLPVALLALERVIRGGTWRAALLLAFSMIVLAYTSGYLVVFAVVMIATTMIVAARDWLPRASGVLGRLALAGIVAALAIAPIYLPYRRVAREQHMVRTIEAIRDFSASPAGYLASAGRLHLSTWSARFFRDPVDSFFPGFVALGLSGAAVVAAVRRRDGERERLRARVLMLVSMGAVGAILSFGAATPVYGWLFDVFPPMQGLRAAARFGNLFLLAVAVLAGIGLAALRAPATAAVALILIANGEALRAPFTYQPFRGIPGIYRLLADEPGPVVLAEQPFYPRSAIFRNAGYVLASTAHWRPLMNGYSGYTPASYQRYADAFWYFPQDWAIQAMKDAGVTHVVVHGDLFLEDNQRVVEVLDKRTDFELIAAGPGGLRLYRLKR
jgi:hypothetical protein